MRHFKVLPPWVTGTRPGTLHLSDFGLVTKPEPQFQPAQEIAAEMCTISPAA